MSEDHTRTHIHPHTHTHTHINVSLGIAGLGLGQCPQQMDLVQTGNRFIDIVGLLPVFGQLKDYCGGVVTLTRKTLGTLSLQ